MDDRNKAVLWLHIGAPKTGTTALQLALEKAGPHLLKEGWLYPLTGRLGPGHHHFARAVSLSRRPAGDTRQIFVQLRKEVEAVQPKNTLISSEDFYLDNDLTLLQKELAWADIRILLYVRQAHGWINSFFAQYIKDPYFRFFDRDSDPHQILDKLARFADVDRLRAYADVFGHDALTVRSYDDPMVRKDLVADACATIGLPQRLLEDQDAPGSDNRSNVSIQADELELVRQSNLLESDEEQRDRWLYELQQVSQLRSDGDRAKKDRFDLGMDTADNASVLDKMKRSAENMLAEYGIEQSAPTPSKKAVGEAAASGDNAGQLHLDVLRTPTLSHSQLVTIGAGLAARSAHFSNQFDGLLDYLYSTEPQTASQDEPIDDAGDTRLVDAMEPAEANAEPPFEMTTISDNDAVVLTGAAADLASPAARLGMIAMFEIGLCEEKRLFVAVGGAIGKPTFVQIQERNDFLRLAAGIAEKTGMSALFRYDKTHIISDPVLPLEPLPGNRLAHEGRVQAALSIDTQATSFVVSKSSPFDFKVALRAASAGKPGFYIGKFIDHCSANYAKKRVMHTIEAVKKLPVMSGLQMDAISPEAACSNIISDALKLDLLYSDYLTVRAAPQAAGMRLYTKHNCLA